MFLFLFFFNHHKLEERTNELEAIIPELKGTCLQFFYGSSITSFYCFYIVLTALNIINSLIELQNTNSLSSKRNKELTKQIEDLQNENTSCLKKINLFEERLHAHQTETDHLKRQVSEEKKSFHDLNGDLETNLNVNTISVQFFSMTNFFK